MADILKGAPARIEGYDLAAESQRLDFKDVTVGGVTINRRTARIDVRGEMEPPANERIREEHQREIFVTTHADDSPVVELGFPVAGPYVACPAGVYFDCQLGVAQKLLDENHPAFARAVDALVKHRALLRREINTDDFFAAAPGARGEIRLPQELASLLNGLAREAFPAVPAFKTFFSNSGTEAIEAGIKLSQIVRYRRLLERHGRETFETLMRQLGIARNPVIEGFDRTRDEPVYRDYPFFVFAFEGAFHGRTMGSLSLTQSKRAHQYGYSKLQWVRHFPWDGAAARLAEIVDARPLLEVLAAEGGVKRLLEAGRVPADLVAAFISEPFQGEGGYRIPDAAAFRDLVATLRRLDIPFFADEVQTFARTGRAFAASHFVDGADIIAIAKGAWVGATIARADWERHLHPGWHSNTWGGGKVFDTQLAYASVDAVARFRDPVLGGLGYFENSRVKGAYLAWVLGRLAERHPALLVSHRGLGLMHGISVRRREEIVREAWRRGLKLLGCGNAGEVSGIRLLFLVDTLGREIDDFARTLDATLAAVGGHPPVAAASKPVASEI